MVDVLYEDNQVVVVVKPQNMPSQADESGDEDLLTVVKNYIKEKYNKPGQAFVGLVHRLDRPTGGIMVFARNSKSAKRLGEQLVSHRMEKTYYAVLEGRLPSKSGHIVNYLKKDEKTNTVKIVTSGETGSKEAVLDYKVLAQSDTRTLVEVKILTGRSHQIRVQFAGLGFPLYGDNKYGKTKSRSKCLGLWSGRLEFVHPTTKEKMVFVAPPKLDEAPWKEFYMQKYFTR